MSCINPLRLFRNGKSIIVPCGRCSECARSYRNQWIARVTEENRCAKVSYFGTLTYDSDSVPLHTFCDDKGVLHCFPVLKKRDVQLFIKKLRKYYDRFNIRLRYYLLGEYGPSTLRPHYHFIVFFDSMVVEDNFRYQVKSNWLKGFVKIDPVIPGRIAYVVKYMLPAFELPERYNDFKPFHLHSVGIGRSYLTERKIQYHKAGLAFSPDIIQNFYYMHENLYKIPLPRYYKDRIFSPSEKAEISYRIKISTERKEEEQQLADYKFQQSLKQLNHEEFSKKIVEHIKESANRINNQLVNAEKETKKLIKKRKL